MNRIKDKVVGGLLLLLPLSYCGGVINYVAGNSQWMKEEQSALRQQNPMKEVHHRFYVDFYFNDDDDPEPDRIERVGFLATGLRGGIPGRLRQTIYRD